MLLRLLVRAKSTQFTSHVAYARSFFLPSTALPVAIDAKTSRPEASQAQLSMPPLGTDMDAMTNATKRRVIVSKSLITIE